jgi:hypothetical protein
MQLDLNQLLEHLRAGLHDEVPNFGALRAQLRLAPPDRALAQDYLIEAGQRGLAAKNARGWRVAALASWFAPTDPRAPTVAQLEAAWSRAKGFGSSAALSDWTALIQAQRLTAREASRVALLGVRWFLLDPTNEVLLPTLLSTLALSALGDDADDAARLCAALRGAGPWGATQATRELLGEAVSFPPELSALWREVERRVYRQGQPYLSDRAQGQPVHRRWDMFGPREDFARAASVAAALGELTRHRDQWRPDAPKLLAQRLEREAVQALRSVGVALRRPSPALPWSVERVEAAPGASSALVVPQVLANCESLVVLGQGETAQRLAGVVLGSLAQGGGVYELWARGLAYPVTPRT